MYIIMDHIWCLLHNIINVWKAWRKQYFGLRAPWPQVVRCFLHIWIFYQMRHFFLFVLSCWYRKEISQELNVALTWLITDRNQDPEWAPDWLHRILSRRLMWGRLSFNIQSWLPSRQSSESLILLEVLCQKQEFCSQGRGLRECNLNVASTF